MMTLQRETLKYYLNDINDIHGALWGDIVWGTVQLLYAFKGSPRECMEMTESRRFGGRGQLEVFQVELFRCIR